MLDFTQLELESERPAKDMNEAVGFCLNQLFLDEEHRIEDEVSPGLTYEELIGALLLAKDTTASQNGS